MKKSKVSDLTIAMGVYLVVFGFKLLFPTDYSTPLKNSESLSSPIDSYDCVARDKEFITNKMGQLNRDVVSVEILDVRKYLVTFVDWKTGIANTDSMVLDYSNAPCE